MLWRPWRNWWMSTVAPLWPVLHHSVTQPRPPDQNTQISWCWLSAVIVWCGTAANIFLVKQSGAEEFSGGAHMKENGVALPPACLLSGSDYYHKYSSIIGKIGKNCILSPWNVVKNLTGLPPACSLDCNGHWTFKWQDATKKRKNITTWNLSDAIHCLEFSFVVLFWFCKILPT